MQLSLTAWASHVPSVQQERQAAEQGRREASAAKAHRAEGLGLAWPPSRKRHVGRPSRKEAYQRFLCDLLERDVLPEDASPDPLAWWKLGMRTLVRPAAALVQDVEDTPLADASEGPAQADMENCPVRKYRRMDDSVKDWFLNFARHQRAPGGPTRCQEAPGSPRKP